LEPQGAPQAPQLLISVCVFVHVPLQVVAPTAQELHVPAVQLFPAGQARAQAPQFWLSLSSFTQRPEQDVNPAGHEASPDGVLSVPLTQLATRNKTHPNQKIARRLMLES
jgi:hypothetical protein